MATQRITIAKIAGIAADVVARQLQQWSAARQATSPHQWSSEQWPQEVRRQADAFADLLRAHAAVPPVIHFVEWVDMWSMGDLFARWLAPPGGPLPFVVHANQFELWGYPLPDGEHLSHYLASAGPQQFEESDWFVGRLWEAVGAWQGLVDRAVLVALRQPVGAFVTDEEVEASLSRVPNWLRDRETSS